MEYFKQILSPENVKGAVVTVLAAVAVISTAASIFLCPHVGMFALGITTMLSVLTLAAMK